MGKKKINENALRECIFFGENLKQIIMDKTFKQVLAFEEQRVNYVYSPQEHMWVQQHF